VRVLDEDRLRHGRPPRCHERWRPRSFADVKDEFSDPTLPIRGSLSATDLMATRS
jgi:hypothetical protein